MSTVKLRLYLKHVNNSLIRAMSTVTQRIPEARFNPSQPFHLFALPTDVTPTFELYRAFTNAMNKMTYYYHERDYSDKKFINGAKLAIMHMAKAISENNLELINEIAVKQFSLELRERLSIIPQDVLKKRLSFTKDNIVHAFIQTLVVAPKKAFDLDPEGLSFYGKVIAVIDPNSTEQVSLNKALKNANDDTLFCNVTVCRHLNPPDIWKVSHINFFEKRFVY